MQIFIGIIKKSMKKDLNAHVPENKDEETKKCKECRNIVHSLEHDD